ncbi:MAG TPA: PQQ-binding-like beta-propeller repeat protein, partial [Phycisphaerae bacterium]|nr:PQQ-binding-like beta-propeller repeat protein [Phycisphaerae bacterium]
MRRRPGTWLLFWGIVLWACGFPGAAPAADWPMWRCDPNRSSCTPDALPARLHCQWVLRGRPLAPAWPDDPRMAFDAAYQPIVKGNALFVGSSRGNFVVAVGIDDAAEKWRFYTNGPVRLAPVAWKDAVYVASDDGCLYCLDAVTGKLRWRFRGAPSDRRVLGNERLISMWPARGGPVVYDGPATRSGRAEVYFAAGIWPFMGVFLYALDATTGDLVWCNESAGSVYIKQPHDSAAFGGIAPQGYIVATAERLFVPNGRAAAAAFDRH